VTDANIELLFDIQSDVNNLTAQTKVLIMQLLQATVSPLQTVKALYTY
jgi:hypothetical protein